jgi:hypothetical protein
VAGAPGTEGRGVPATRTAGSLSSDSHGVLVVGGGGRREWRGAGSPREVGSCAPSPRAVEAAEGQVSGAGAEAPAAKQSTEGAARATKASARAVEASGSAAAATAAATTTPVEPSMKRKRGFSTLR